MLDLTLNKIANYINLSLITHDTCVELLTEILHPDKKKK